MKTLIPLFSAVFLTASLVGAEGIPLIAPATNTLRVAALAPVVAQEMAVLARNKSGEAPLAAIPQVVRKVRNLEEKEIRELLTFELQRRFARDRGELEIRFNRPWKVVSMLDGPLELQLLGSPTQGLQASMSLHFQLKSNSEILGEWFQPVGIKLWSSVWIAPNVIRRGTPLSEIEPLQDRRDLIGIQEALLQLPENIGAWEIGESMNSGQVLTRRSIRLRTVIARGAMVDGIVRSGRMEITAKVEALEDGIPGQLIRIRNVRTRHEMRGRIENEGTVIIPL